MKCIFCGGKTKVNNSAASASGSTCRRLMCTSCSNKFYTIEKVATQLDLEECRTALWTRTKTNTEAN